MSEEVVRHDEKRTVFEDGRVTESWVEWRDGVEHHIVRSRRETANERMARRMAMKRKEREEAQKKAAA